MRPIITAATLAAIAAIAATCTPTLAQPFIEIGWEGTVISAFPGAVPERVGARTVFDAAALPSATDPSWIQFRAVEAELFNSSASTDPGAETPYAPASSDMYYWIADNRFQIYVGPRYLTISHAGPDFMAGMDSLPDDPGSYAIADGSNQYAVISGGTGAAIWYPGSGFDGGVFRYWIREVENPNPPEPCIADADGNGILDLSDVNIFAATFVAGCP